MNAARLTAWARVLLSVLVAGLILAAPVAALAGAACWLLEGCALLDYADLLQYGAIVVVGLGAIATLAQSPIGPRYRELARFMPFTRTARDPSLYVQMMAERNSSLWFLLTSLVAAVILYLVSTLIYRTLA